MKQLTLWLEATRPKTLVLSIAPVLIGTSYGYYKGSFNLLTFFVTLLSSLLIQIGTNLANDYFDFLKGADTSERTGPRRMTQSGLISVAHMKLATFLTFSVVALLSIYMTSIGGPIFTLLSAIAIACGILYTGGPKPLGYLGLGEFFVLVFFGPVGAAGAAYLQTLSFSWEAVILGLTPGFLSSAVLIINNYRDIEQDRKANKKTLAVRFGPLFSKIEYTSFILLGCLLPLAYGWWLSAFALIPAFIPIKALWRGSGRDSELPPIFAQTAQICLLASALLAFGLIAYAV